MDRIVYETNYGRIVFNAEDGDYLIFWRGNFCGARASLFSAQRLLRGLEGEARRRSPWLFNDNDNKEDGNGTNRLGSVA